MALVSTFQYIYDPLKILVMGPSLLDNCYLKSLKNLIICDLESLKNNLESLKNDRRSLKIIFPNCWQAWS